MRFLSVCSGMECASLAFGPLGWTAAGFAEIDPFASALLAHHYGSNPPGEPPNPNAPPNFGDFTKIDCAQLGAVDLLCGGTPCQAFSLAGARLSLADARGNLTLSFVALAHELARANGLRNVLWENVPGVLSTDDNAFGCFLGALVGANDPVLPCPRPALGKSNAGWRWRDDERVVNDDGAERIKPAQHVAKWPDVGMVAGPFGRAAWRLFDAQYFGLAQRRERVFLVADFGNGADPAAVLFESKSLRGNSAPRRETGKNLAGTLEASAGRRCGQPNDHDPAGGLVYGVRREYLGNAEGGAVDAPFPTVSNLGKTVNNQTPLIGEIAHTLRGEGFDASEDGTGRGTPIVPVMAFSAKDHGADLAYDISPTLRAGGFTTSHANAGVMPAIAQGFAFDLRGREGGAVPEGPHETANLRAASGGSSRSYVAQAFGISADAFDRSGEGATAAAGERSGLGISEELCPALKAKRPNGVATRWAVRRLTPTECERLQGAPDGYTRIPWKGKPASECPDGHRYKVLGNGWAINNVAWIARRLDAALRVA